MTRKNRNVQAVIPKGNEKGTKGAQKEPRVASKRIDVSVLTYKILGANIITRQRLADNSGKYKLEVWIQQ